MKKWLALAFGVIVNCFLVWKVYAESGKWTAYAFGFLLLIICGIIMWMQEVETTQKRIKRAIRDLWLHTERYPNDFIHIQELQNKKRMTLIDRFKLLIENDGKEKEVHCSLHDDNPTRFVVRDVILGSKYYNMSFKKLEKELDRLDAKRDALMTEADYGPTKDNFPERLDKAWETSRNMEKDYDIALKVFAEKFLD